MKRSAAEDHSRVWSVSGCRQRAWRHVRRSARLVRDRRQAERPRSREREDRALDRCRRARGNRLRRQAPVSDSPRIASRRSIRRPAVCSRRSRRPAAAATRGSRGPKARCGSGNIASGRSIRVDPETGAILRTIESNRFVTGVTWVDGELWHGTWEGDESDVRRIDPEPERCWSGSRCRTEPACRGSSPTAAIGSSAAAETAAK